MVTHKSRVRANDELASMIYYKTSHIQYKYCVTKLVLPCGIAYSESLGRTRDRWRYPPKKAAIAGLVELPIELLYASEF